MNIENELAKRDAMIQERNERIKELEELVRDMWHELNYECVRTGEVSQECIERVDAFDVRMERLGL